MTPTTKTTLKEHFSEDELCAISFALSRFADDMEEKANAVKNSSLGSQLYEKRKSAMLQARMLSKMFD